MNEPNGDAEESQGPEPAAANPRPPFAGNPERKNNKQAEAGQDSAYEGEDEIERTIKAFWQHVKSIYREARPGERLNTWLTLVLIFCSATVAVIYYLQLRQMIDSTKATKGSATAAQSAAETAAAQLEMSERPWLSIANPHVTTPLAWGSNGLQVTVQFDVRNTGPSPAPMLLPNAELFVLPLKPPGILEHIASLCAPTTHLTSGVLPELVVPPNDKLTETLTIGVNDTGKGKSPVDVIAPIISIRYRSTFGTGRNYPYCSLVSYGLWPTIFKAQEGLGYFISMDRLSFQQVPMFGEIFR